MILELYSKAVQCLAKTILLLASVIASLLFLIEVANIFSVKTQQYPPVAFIFAPVMAVGCYYASRFFPPTPKESRALTYAAAAVLLMILFLINRVASHIHLIL